MSAPPTPSLFTGIAAVFRLSWKRTLRGRKLRLGVAATLLVVVAAVTARYMLDAAEPANVVEAGLRLGFFGLLAYLVPFLFASGAIAEEVELRTFPFLAMRPAGRAAIALGKFFSASVASIALLGAGVLLLHVASFVTEPTDMIDELPDTLRSLGALALLATCHSAMCLFWGAVLVEASGLVAGLYLAVVEFGGSWIPGFVRFVSMTYVAGQLAGLPKGGFWVELVPEFDTWIYALIVTLVTLIYVGLSWAVVQVREFGFGKA